MKCLEIGGGDCFVANQIVQAVQKPATECIAVWALFRMQLENEIIFQNLVAKANDEWGDVASDIAEMLNIYFLCILNVLKDAL